MTRPDDWPSLEQITPDEARDQARFHRWFAAATGEPAWEAVADAFLEEADAVEAGDDRAWADAVARQVKATPHR